MTLPAPGLPPHTKLTFLFSFLGGGGGVSDSAAARPPGDASYRMHAGELGDQLVVSAVRDGAAVRDEREQVPLHPPLV